MARKETVGLIVLTEIPEMGLVAILQRRGEWNTEKMGPESYPGVCQVTVHGKVEEVDRQYPIPANHALWREIDEELGPGAKTYIQEAPDDNGLRLVHRHKTLDALVITWAVKLPCEFLRAIVLHPDSGGIRLLRHDQIKQIQDVHNFSKTAGVDLLRTTAMFPDERAALSKAFAAFA